MMYELLLTRPQSHLYKKSTAMGRLSNQRWHSFSLDFLLEHRYFAWHCDQTFSIKSRVQMVDHQMVAYSQHTGNAKPLLTLSIAPWLAVFDDWSNIPAFKF
jgi:hypothetical protein